MFEFFNILDNEQMDLYIDNLYLCLYGTQEEKLEGIQFFNHQIKAYNLPCPVYSLINAFNIYILDR